MDGGSRLEFVEGPGAQDRPASPNETTRTDSIPGRPARSARSSGGTGESTPTRETARPVARSRPRLIEAMLTPREPRTLPISPTMPGMSRFVMKR